MNTMTDDIVYLKQNVITEALFDRWYAWSHLVSPATSALNIKDRHLKIMNSYIKNPRIHAAAVAKPEMRGGPFIDYGGERVDEIKALYDHTLEKHANKLELADAINELTQMLHSSAKGNSLNDLYAKVPEILKGYVELYYDLSNQPNFRFFEALLMESEYYDESSQTIALQLVEADDQRPFVLSTPRLDDPKIIHCPIPMKDERIDELFDMQVNPKSYSEIKEKFGITADQEDLFKTFFTKETPKPYEKYKGEGIRTRYFGHACILVETEEVSMLVDPVISYDGYESDVPRYTAADLPEKIDYVLITHNHQDHIVFETLLQLRNRIGAVVVPSYSKGNVQDPSLRLMFKKIGFKNVIELDDMESIDLPNCVITGVPFLGEHGDLDIRSKLCFHVKLHNEFKVLFVADSCNIESKIYDRVKDVLGDIDVLFLGMECDGAPSSWLYGPLMPNQLEREHDQFRRLAGSNCAQGMDLVETFNPKDVFVYAMGMEPWLEFISSIKYTDESRPIIESNKLVEMCKAKGIRGERLFGERTLEYMNEEIVLI